MVDSRTGAGKLLDDSGASYSASNLRSTKKQKPTMMALRGYFKGQRREMKELSVSQAGAI